MVKNGLIANEVVYTYLDVVIAFLIIWTLFKRPSLLNAKIAIFSGLYKGICHLKHPAFREEHGGVLHMWRVPLMAPIHLRLLRKNDGKQC